MIRNKGKEGKGNKSWAGKWGRGHLAGEARREGNRGESRRERSGGGVERLN